MKYFHFILSAFVASIATVESNLLHHHKHDVDIASSIQVLAFTISLTCTGSPNRPCDPDEETGLKNVMQRELESLGPVGLGLASKAGDARFNIIDMKLDIETVTDAPEFETVTVVEEDTVSAMMDGTADQHVRRRRLAGKWVYDGAASCYKCLAHAEEETKDWKGTEVGHFIVVPAMAMDTLHAAIAQFFENTKQHCMASSVFTVDMQFVPMK